MCLAIPAQVVGLSEEHPHLALVEVSGARRTVNIGLIEPDGVAPGDWVLVHVGFAMTKVDQAEAAATMASLESYAGGYADEVEAFVASATGEAAAGAVEQPPDQP